MGGRAKEMTMARYQYCYECEKTQVSCEICRETAANAQEGALFGIPLLRNMVHHFHAHPAQKEEVKEK